jgi:hypothetical protein
LAVSSSTRLVMASVGDGEMRLRAEEMRLIFALS